MDRTSWIGVVVCVILLFVWGWWSTQEAAKQAARQAAERAAQAERAPAEVPEGQTRPGDPAEAPEDSAPSDPDEVPEVAERKATLENEFVRLHLTNRGAGIRLAEMRKHKRHLKGNGVITINENAENGIGALSTGPGEFDTANWRIVDQSDRAVSFETETDDGLHLRKIFRLPGGDSDPHEISMELILRNDSGSPMELGDRFLYAGSAAPLHLHEWSMQIGMYWMSADGDFEYETVDHFGGKKVLGIFGKNEIPHDVFPAGTLEWAGVNDQFFTTIVQPETPYPATLWGSRFSVVVEGDEQASKERRMFAAEGGIGLPDLAMNAGDQQTLRYNIYLGPKEFSRLRDLGNDRQRVMHYDEIPVFGWLFGWAIKPLASFLISSLVFVKGFAGNYGVAIIVVTLLIRLAIWPVYAKSARSMKRMSKLTPKMKELREKYPDDPQKVNEETMKMYRTYGINPLGGCLPMFIQLPVFLAFYRMLWSAVEVRHESFLWVDDLAMPDTLFTIPGLGIPFNLLPILMGITSFLQIAITPKTGDKTQQMIFMLMPVIFLVICYNFAAALSLYWTTSNAFSILQTWIMNKLPEPELTKKAGSGKKSFMERMKEQAEAAQKAKGGSGAPAGPGDRTKMPGEKGARHTKGKKKRR
ncbi:MAG: membrane protein insertase YidC [Verrucomicrobiales bacterium]